MIDPHSLERYSLFGGLLPDQIERILPLLEQETHEEGARIIVQGTPNDRIRFILEGRVSVVKDGLILCDYGEGDAFGEMAVLDVMPSVATVVARAPTRVMSISNRALHEIYKRDPALFAMLIMNLARELSRRLRAMDEKAVQKESPFSEWA